MGNVVGSTVNGYEDRPKPGVAAVLSFFVPGVGQFYNGAFLRGIFWLIVTPGIWFWSASMFGWVCHLVAAYTAYRYAEKRLAQ
jgi:TM2 domain-containing membrane protein YozV